jgi:hypothetical protein
MKSASLALAIFLIAAPFAASQSLRDLFPPPSVNSALSFSLVSSPESEKPEWCKALHAFGGFSFLLAAARKE